MDNNQSVAPANSYIGVWASLKHVVITACNVLVKTCTVADTSLDTIQDLVDTAKVYTNQTKQEAHLTAQSQLAQLTLNTNSDQPTS